MEKINSYRYHEVFQKKIDKLSMQVLDIDTPDAIAGIKNGKEVPSIFDKC